MLRIIDESREIDMTAKYDVDQEVVVTYHQGYRKGVVSSVSAHSNKKGTVFIYTVEMYVHKKSSPLIQKCMEHHVFGTVREALEALAQKEEAKNKQQENAETQA